MADKPIKCRDCQIDAQVVVENDQPQRVVCPRCGASEEFDITVRSLTEQAEAFAAKELQKAFSGMAALDEGGMIGMSVSHSPAKINEATGKFVLDFD